MSSFYSLLGDSGVEKLVPELTRIVFVSGILAVIVIFFIKRERTEAYSLDHGILNVTTPKTLWMNMGYWKVVFSEAVLKVGHRSLFGRMCRFILANCLGQRYFSRVGYPWHRQWMRWFNLFTIKNEASNPSRHHLSRSAIRDFSTTISRDWLRLGWCREVRYISSKWTSGSNICCGLRLPFLFSNTIFGWMCTCVTKQW